MRELWFVQEISPRMIEPNVGDCRITELSAFAVSEMLRVTPCKIYLTEYMFQKVHDEMFCYNRSFRRNRRGILPLKMPKDVGAIIPWEDQSDDLRYLLFRWI